MENLIEDLRFAIRILVSRPAVTTAAVASLALGIGANTAVFSVMNATSGPGRARHGHEDPAHQGR